MREDTEVKISPRGLSKMSNQTKPQQNKTTKIRGKESAVDRSNTRVRGVLQDMAEKAGEDWQLTSQGIAPKREHETLHRKDTKYLRHRIRQSYQE